MALSINTIAPDFTLLDQEQKEFNLYKSLDSGKWVVMFFYPKDFTGGCTAEVCEFRDKYADFVDSGTLVVGISADGHSSHSKFAKAYNLQFPILSDFGDKVSSAYQIGKAFFLIKSRITFIISPTKEIVEVIENNLNPTAHISKALDVLRSKTI